MASHGHGGDGGGGGANGAGMSNMRSGDRPTATHRLTTNPFLTVADYLVIHPTPALKHHRVYASITARRCGRTSGSPRSPVQISPVCLSELPLRARGERRVRGGGDGVGRKVCGFALARARTRFSPILRNAQILLLLRLLFLLGGPNKVVTSSLHAFPPSFPPALSD